jgi:A/G-specific adenine glycosylase
MAEVCQLKNLDKALTLDDVAMRVSAEKTKCYVDRLLKWGKKNERRFAWRKETDPFHILIAEIMLQRTGARQVEPVYAEFVARYPSIRDLLKAPYDDVLSCLRPLGLAYRAVRLKQLAETLEKEFDGMVPKSEPELLSLPGVGKYVANAVRCFAFKEDVPIVDTNVLRVLNRVFSVDSIDSHKDPKIWGFAARLIPAGKARDLNISTLDFASFVCTARRPHHDICPFKDICDFHQKKRKHALS